MKEFLKGGDIIINVELFDDNDATINFDNYFVDLLFYTMAGDVTIRATDKSNSDVVITRVTDNVISMVITSTLLSTLKSGKVVCEMRLTHKITGLKSVVDSNAFILNDSQIERVDS